MNFVLKALPTELGPVFAHLFQQSMDTGEIPKEWSLANICPLFKKSDRSPACNYRPVSLTCVPCKLLEHIVCSNIMAHLDKYKLLSDRQHAFRKGHSCETQLTTVINDWAKILAPVLSGVRQSTVLGPLLFSLYINDISSDIESEIRLFADDCAIVKLRMKKTQ